MVVAAHAEKERLLNVQEQTEQRSRLLNQRYNDLQTKKEQLLKEINENKEKYSELTQQINEAKAKTQEFRNQKAKLRQEKKTIQKETDECNEAITTLKQQITDRKLAEEAEKQAQEVMRKAEEARKLAEEKKRQEEEQRKKQEEEQRKKQEEELKQQQQQQENQQKEEPKPIDTRQTFVEPVLSPLKFNEKEFKRLFLNKKNIHIDVISPPQLTHALDTEDISRSCELEYMWKGVELSEAHSLSNYGALLYLTDKSATDLAASFILQAAEKKEPYALYNAACLILNRVIRGTPESACQYIIDAGQLGEPNSSKLIQSFVKCSRK